jgi:hypothetical protein
VEVVGISSRVACYAGDFVSGFLFVATLAEIQKEYRRYICHLSSVVSMNDPPSMNSSTRICRRLTSVRVFGSFKLDL